MGQLRGLKCRECGRVYPAAPVHVCEFCFGPLEVPSLSVFDQALADLKV